MKDGKIHGIKLSTLPTLQNDTTIDNLNITLKELNPYPDLKRVSLLTDYNAKLIVVNLDKIKSNAKILSFWSR